MDVEVRPARATPPGRIIRRELGARGWTQKDLAEITGRSEQVISQIVRGRKQITSETAHQLAAAFGTSADLWLNLEASYQLDRARQIVEPKGAIRRIAHRHPLRPGRLPRVTR